VVITSNDGTLITEESGYGNRRRNARSESESLRRVPALIAVITSQAHRSMEIKKSARKNKDAGRTLTAPSSSRVELSNTSAVPL
jgi:hypothetical protein